MRQGRGVPIACFALPAAGAQNAPMNRDLDRLAEQLGLDRADHELVRLRFGHACALRVRHLPEAEARRLHADLSREVARRPLRW